jgi:hypothetical protein
MDANTRSRIRRHIANAGYSATAIRQGLDYAKAEGATTGPEGYILAMSRILFTDDDLARGVRFSVENGAGPR